MRVYVDSSAMLKRVFAETESVPLRHALRSFADDGVAMVSSSLAWVEVARAVRAYLAVQPDTDVHRPAHLALSGIIESPISPEVVALARRVDPLVLRSLHAVHLATALLLDVDLMVSYDQRLRHAAERHQIPTAAPAN